MTDLDFTGERLVPDKSPAHLVAEHRARYKFAVKFIEGMNVIDIGCGEGYGSYLMGGFAETVVGVDLSEEAVVNALELYSSDKVDFKTGDVTRLSYPENEFDAGVCFEVIEHIENPGDLLKEAGRVIKPGGIFIVSTPNGGVRVSSQKNPFHVKEFTLAEFSKLLEDYFPIEKWEIEIYGQFVVGKNYSLAGVIFKNIYLAIKGALGIKPKPSIDDGSDAVGYEFKPERAKLAEYLVGVVRGKG